ncbi:hypothetical protein [Hydrogenimonas urashimensis]|uniref:hypothetical protein n=1 Tax=Hydrogenimonas urashimensis TaxID=2740515 RepID=UPI0019169C50|nr:hypothetical protein [Hydrogenimonas urashimensis]
MKKGLIALAMLILGAAPIMADSYQVMFETMSCDGETGFATAKIDEIYKVESADCYAPDGSGQKLKKILVKKNNGTFHVFTLTAEEAKNVMKEMKDYMHARKKSLENSNTIIFRRE